MIWSGRVWSSLCLFLCLQFRLVLLTPSHQTPAMQPPLKSPNPLCSGPDTRQRLLWLQRSIRRQHLHPGKCLLSTVFLSFIMFATCSNYLYISEIIWILSPSLILLSFSIRARSKVKVWDPHLGCAWYNLGPQIWFKEWINNTSDEY